MKLPDYNSSQMWEKLRSQMGATEIVELNAVEYHGLTKKELKKLSTKSIRVESIDDIVNAEDGTFEYKGKKVLVYIKEQRTSMWGSNYKFHISQCATITDQQRKKRYNRRYVQTTRVDGFFEVIQDYGSRTEEKMIKMDVCINCLKHMRVNYRNDDLFSSFSNFSINKYFQSYSNKIKALPSNTSLDYKQDNYSNDWSRLSRSLREKNNWVCEGCGESYIDHKRELHVHHINGLRSDNSKENLAVLCKSCHSNQPGHEHMGRSGKRMRNPDHLPKSTQNDNPINLKKIKENNYITSFDCKKIIEHGEGEKIEFKSALRWNQHRKCDDPEIIISILRTVAAFMNTEGGILLVGVNDSGQSIGIDKSFKNFDKANLYFGNKFNQHFESHLSLYCKWNREKYEGKDIMVIEAKPSPKPVHFNPGKDLPSEFWIRQGARKTQLDSKDIFPYISNRFK